MFDDSIMPFGEHKGKKFKDVPDSYLLYLHNQSIEGSRKLFGELKEYIKENIDAIKSNVKYDNYN